MVTVQGKGLVRGAVASHCRPVFGVEGGYVLPERLL